MRMLSTQCEEHLTVIPEIEGGCMQFTLHSPCTAHFNEHLERHLPCHEETSPIRLIGADKQAVPPQRQKRRHGLLSDVFHCYRLQKRTNITNPKQVMDIILPTSHPNSISFQTEPDPSKHLESFFITLEPPRIPRGIHNPIPQTPLRSRDSNSSYHDRVSESKPLLHLTPMPNDPPRDSTYKACTACDAEDK